MVALAAAACAKIEPPPGGPPDNTPPRLVSTSPDSLSVIPGFDGEVEFRFSEVVSEGGTASFGTGFGDLERLVVLSPTTRVPEVSWRRDRITVRPREGWRPNTVYRIELLPGISDLRNNRAENGAAVVTFTTGAPVPVDTVRGAVWDWTVARPAAGALVEAVLLPDSLAYRFVTDSAGRFVLAPLPAGTYHVTAALDPDRDRRRTGREPFDTVTVATTDARALELWTFPHDTTGPRIAELASSDSLAVRIRFSQLLDPSQAFDSTDISVRQLPDSVPVPAVALLRQERYDSLYRQAAPALPDSLVPVADSAAAPAPARPDTAAADTAAADSARARMDAELKGRTGRSEPVPSRAALSDQLMLRTGAALVPGRSYAITVTGVRNASGVAADVSGVLQVPVPTAPLPADTLAPPAVPPAPADSGLPIRR